MKGARTERATPGTLPLPPGYSTIDGSNSPNGRFALALAESAESSGGWSPTGTEKWPSSHLVDLRTGKVLSKTADVPDTSHRTVSVAWAPDSRTMVQANAAKWATTSFALRTVGADGKLSAPVDLLGPTIKGAIASLKASGNQAAQTHGDTLAFMIGDVKIGKGGLITCGLSGEVPKSTKEGDFLDATVQLRVVQAKNGPQVKIEGVKDLTNR